MKKIDIIVPLLNEFEVIDELLSEIKNTINNYESDQVEISLVLVDDGSTEEFRKLLKNHKKNFDFKLIELSRNYGQQIAFKAGIQQTTADAVVLMDGDLQDPPSLIPEMVDAYLHYNLQKEFYSEGDKKVKVSKKMGYVSSVDDARTNLEKIFNTANDTVSGIATHV